MKKFLSLVLALVMAFASSGMTSTLAATSAEGAIPFADLNITTCYAGLKSANEIITITMTVNGNGVQDKIGVSSVEVYKKNGSKWDYVTSFSSDETHSEFFAYKREAYSASTFYEGTAGQEYKITIHALAQKGSTSGTKTYSKTIVCK